MAEKRVNHGPSWAVSHSLRSRAVGGHVGIFRSEGEARAAALRFSRDWRTKTCVTHLPGLWLESPGLLRPDPAYPEVRVGCYVVPRRRVEREPEWKPGSGKRGLKGTRERAHRRHRRR